MPRIARPTRRAASLLVCLAATTACSQLVEYTDELTDPSTGRTAVTRTTATITGAVGFTVGLPVSLVALPVTYPLYRYQSGENPTTADPASAMLFPSFVLWRAGALLAAPVDLVEFGVWRAWQPPREPTREEQEAIEARIDDDMLPAYRVHRIYPHADPGPDGW